jgi:hypothetical protein
MIWIQQKLSHLRPRETAQIMMVRTLSSTMRGLALTCLVTETPK